MLRSKRRLAVASAVLLGAGLVAGPVTAAQANDDGHHQSGAPRKVVTAYFADWDIYGRGYFVKDIPADKLNVIQYAFGVPTFDKATGKVGCGILDPWADFQRPAGTADSVDGVADSTADANQHLFGNFNQLRKLKARYPNLKVEISLGGWTKSTWFASVAATKERRQAFVTACIDTFIKGDLPTGGWPEQAGGAGAAAGVFDGIDLDWEYPTALAGGNVDYGPADRHNATLLASEFRSQLDALGRANHKQYLLTAALPAAKSSTKYYELASFVRQLDWVNVMTYDFNVPGGTVAAHDTLFRSDPRDPNGNDWTWNTTGTVIWYLANGVPASKIVVGVPFYANQYLRSNGLYQPFDNTGLDANLLEWDKTPQPTYHALVDVGGVVSADGQGQLGFTRHWNWRAGEPYLFNPAATHVLASGTVTAPTVIVYSDPCSIAERTRLVRSWGLRGAMAWEISQDSDAHALIGALTPVLS
jgi:chitinase